jgi:hypothetical protein
MTARRLLVAAGLAVLLTGLISAPVAADCQGPDSTQDALAAAQVAFVGTVIATRENAPGAVFKVQEIWVGSVSSPAEIHGMFGDDRLAEDDRLFKAGARYLVIPFRRKDGLLRDHICTGTTEWRAGLAELRPPDAEILSGLPSGATGEEPAPPPVSLLIAALAAALVIGVGVVAFRNAARR